MVGRSGETAMVAAQAAAAQAAADQAAADQAALCQVATASSGAQQEGGDKDNAAAAARPMSAWPVGLRIDVRACEKQYKAIIIDTTPTEMSIMYFPLGLGLKESIMWADVETRVKRPQCE